MTATLAASTSILKVRYPDGRLPLAVYKKFKYVATVKKREDFTGISRVIALQNENPQGSSADFPTAQGAVQQGTYNNFNVTRVEHFGVARIKGQALKAAQGDAGALTDLWKNECEGIERTEMQNLEIYAFGVGNGILSTIGSYTPGSATLTLARPEDSAKFALFMKIQAATGTATSYSLTLTGGGSQAKITGIDRVNGILTFGGALDAMIPGIAAGQNLGRAGDLATAGIPSVIVGIPGFIVGGTNPPPLYGLTRASDPVRLAGQAYTATSIPMEEATQEMSALVAQQGGTTPTRQWMHTRDFANLKKSLGTKVSYPKTTVGGVAGVGFSGVQVEGDDGPITIMTSPFITRNQSFLVDQDSFTLDSLGPAPMLLDFDKAEMLRVAGDDAYETRLGYYAAHYTNNPLSGIAATGFGA